MDNRESFIKHFERYFRLKKYQGEDMFKSDKEMVREEALKYFKNVKDVIQESEYADFFEWLGRSQISYVDISQFPGKVYNWTNSNSNNKANTHSKEIPKEFKNFLNSYGFIAEWIIDQQFKNCNDLQVEAYRCTKEFKDLKRIVTVTTNFACPGTHQDRFLDMPIHACYNKFYEYLYGVGIKDESIKLMEKEYQRFKDQAVRLTQERADGKKKIFDIIREMKKEMTIEYREGL